MTKVDCENALGKIITTQVTYKSTYIVDVHESFQIKTWKYTMHFA